jgi:hypothetical protein
MILLFWRSMVLLLAYGGRMLRGMEKTASSLLVFLAVPPETKCRISGGLATAYAPPAHTGTLAEKKPPADTLLQPGKHRLRFTMHLGISHA